eukprot:6209924-Pleurochrysis_carterae.AAC.6
MSDGGDAMPELAELEVRSQLAGPLSTRKRSFVSIDCHVNVHCAHNQIESASGRVRPRTLHVRQQWQS